jgi:molecular chaperone GrpE
MMTDSKPSPDDDAVLDEQVTETSEPQATEAEGQEVPSEQPAQEEPAQGEAASAEEPQPQDEQEDYKDQYLRLRADFENFRKRTRREKEEWTQRCLENICTDMMTILDHFDLGIENARGQEISPDTLKGFEMICGQLSSVLGKYGLEAVEAKEGAFDPNLHEAITHLPSPEVAEGEIVAMTRKGYQLGTKLLRPAQVVVSAGEGDG